MSEKVPWNLSVNAELKRQMLIYCAANNKEISELTEQLYMDFLNANRVREADLQWPSDAPEKSAVVIPKTPLPTKKAAAYRGEHREDRRTRGKGAQGARRSKTKYKTQGAPV